MSALTETQLTEINDTIQSGKTYTQLWFIGSQVNLVQEKQH
jgi:hypothetical protein